MAESLDIDRLEREVKSVYRDVADAPDEEFHFEMGRALAERLGYSPADLDRIPDEAVDSFAGVGYHFDLAALEAGDDVLDLGSGSGMDAFVAALHVGDDGSVTGLDMTDEQLANARQLRDEAGMETVSFEQGYIEELPFEDEMFDVVITNGVVNLSAAKDRVFEEINRVLRPNGRVALSDITSERRLPERIKSDADLWAACIGGAEQVDDYTTMVETAGFELTTVRENDEYEFISEQAQGACQTYGVRSISLGARKR
ncbi:methyltransferase domain-containing protein [Natronorubrum bangense]|uniref:Arsenite methyltransferase n=2 Tax=Natronorubrum bangense TaxID=61858 RepID=L9WEL0_9EURY|nr:methyltransferase domain-containing protein [Natronorubrum bangense]ELY47792.1 methyltransferase type 11 [Natronorubrum bangense JCM 10635]QCC53728.1 methyltransferase domain-containing protein [Natronorubrum bangense]